MQLGDEPVRACFVLAARIRLLRNALLELASKIYEPLLATMLNALNKIVLIYKTLLLHAKGMFGLTVQGDSVLRRLSLGAGKEILHLSLESVLEGDYAKLSLGFEARGSPAVFSTAL